MTETKAVPENETSRALAMAAVSQNDDIITELKEVNKTLSCMKNLSIVSNERQRKENKISIIIAVFMFLIASAALSVSIFAFYVDIVRIDDLSILKERTMEYVISKLNGG